MDGSKDFKVLKVRVPGGCCCFFSCLGEGSPWLPDRPEHANAKVYLVYAGSKFREAAFL